MTAIIAEKATEDPDIVATHELARVLGEKGVAPETLLRGVAIDEAVQEAGSCLDEVEAVVLPVVRKFGNKTAEVCEKANEYSKVIEETGYTHEQLLAELPKKAREVEQMNMKLSTGGAELESLEQKIATARSGLDHLVDLERVRKGLQKIGKTPRQAAAIVEKCGEVLDRGLTVDTIDKVSAEVERLGTKVTNVPRMVAELLERHGSLQTAVDQAEKRLTMMGRTEKKLRRSVGFLTDQKTSLVKQYHDLRVNVKGLRSDYNALGARSAAREVEQIRMFAVRQREQDQILAARRQSFQMELDNKNGEYQRKFDAMDRHYRSVEDTHKEIISSLEKEKTGLERDVVALTATKNQLAATIESNRALSGFLWTNEPTKMRALFPISAKENVNLNLVLSGETRTFLLDAMLGVAVEDARFWPQSMGRYLTNGQRSLIVILSQVWRKKQSLETENSKLAATLTKQEEALEHDYPTWKVLDNDPAFLERFLGSRDEMYLINVFRNFPITAMPRVNECLRKAEVIQDHDINKMFDDWVHNQYASFARDLIREMEGLMGQGPVYLQAGPTRSSTAKTPYSVPPQVDNLDRRPRMQ